MRCTALSTLLLAASTSSLAKQLYLTKDIQSKSSQHYKFNHPIKRVAVIGAGPSGLQVAAELVEHGFEVRLFERTPRPGNAWYLDTLRPLPAAFP